MCLQSAGWMAHSVDPDQTAQEQFDLDLHCLLSRVYNVPEFVGFIEHLRMA